MTLEDIISELNKDKKILSSLEEVDGLLEQIAEFLRPLVNKNATAVANQLAQNYRTSVINEAEEKINGILFNMKIYEKGVKHLESSKG